MLLKRIFCALRILGWLGIKACCVNVKIRVLEGNNDRPPSSFSGARQLLLLAKLNLIMLYVLTRARGFII